VIQALTDERTSSETDEWISQLKVVVRADRRTRKRRAIQEPQAEPTTEASDDRPNRITDRPAHVQHRWAGGWTCWACHRWSSTPLATRCENFVVVSMSYVPGTVPRPRFHWDRWRLGGGTKREHDR
jgi:hypothetical protein